MITVRDFAALVYDPSLVYFVKIDGSDNQLSQFDQGTVELMSRVFVLHASYMYSIESRCTKRNIYDTAPAFKQLVISLGR